MSPPALLLLLALCGGASAQFFQFQQGGINLEDLMGGAFGGGGGGGHHGGGGRGGYEELPQEEEEEEVDLYERLGIQPEATDREIKSAYRKLSVQLHPDKNPDGSTLGRFREVWAAPPLPIAWPPARTCCSRRSTRPWARPCFRWSPGR